MRVVALISGGKDSCYNMMQCVSEGHEVVALANLKPHDKDELDSYMYQTVGHHAIDLYADAMGLPLYRRTIEGISVARGRDYCQTTHDEVEDLYELLKQVKREVGVEAVSVGAILSDYQRVRVENVCMRLGLTPLAYLWRRDQSELLDEMIKCGVNAIIIKVAAMGLEPHKHLGQTLQEIQPHMLKMSQKYGLNVCGEGGEYETFTLDCPLFNKAIVIDRQDTVLHSDDAFAPVAYLNLLEMHLQDKQLAAGKLSDRLKDYPMKRSCDVSQELMSEENKNQMSLLPDNLFPPHIPDVITTYRQDIKPCYHKHKDEALYISQVCVVHTDSCSISDITSKTMTMLKNVLEENDLALSDLVAVHLHVRDMSQFASINAVYKTFFSINPPARVCIQACLPAHLSLLVDAVAKRDPHRLTMHVQGISHWAPANIGPYSQAVKVDEVVYIAGQIPLNPGNMTIVSPCLRAQSRLSLRHVSSVLSAMTINTACSVSLLICYVTHPVTISIATEEWKTWKDEQGIDTCLSLHPLFVVVPRLPRDSCVEWHVQAISISDHCDSGTLTDTETGDLVVTSSYQMSTSSRNLDSHGDDSVDVVRLNFTAHIRKSQTADSVSDLEIARLFIKALKSITQTTCLGHSEALYSLRAFVSTNVNFIEFQEAYRVSYMEVFNCSEEQVCPVSVIPVLSLSSSDHLLSACQ